MTNEHRVKAAAELIRSYDRLHNIKDELNSYNLPALQKSAAVGHNKETRIKVAALIRQHEIEKQAFMKALGSLGKGLYNAGSTFAKGVGNAASDAMTDMKHGYRQVKHNVMAPINNAGAAIKGFGQGLVSAPTRLGKGIYDAASDVGQGFSNASNSLYKGFTGQPATKQAFAPLAGLARMAPAALRAGQAAFRAAPGAIRAAPGAIRAGAGGAAREFMSDPMYSAALAAGPAAVAGGALGSRLSQKLPRLGGFSPSGINPNAPTPQIKLPSQSMPMPQAKPQYDPTLSLGQYSPLGQ